VYEVEAGGDRVALDPEADEVVATVSDELRAAVEQRVWTN
jgi:hypothetical protein